MHDNMITWNIRNWVTVFLMFLLGWFLVMAGVRLVAGRQLGSMAGVGNYMPLTTQQTGTAGT